MRPKSDAQIIETRQDPSTQENSDDHAEIPLAVSSEPEEKNFSDLISIKELSHRLGISEKAIRRKMEKGILLRGLHWFRPPGYRTIFSWHAIEESIRCQRGLYGQASAWPKDASDGLHSR